MSEDAPKKGLTNWQGRKALYYVTGVCALLIVVKALFFSGGGAPTTVSESGTSASVPGVASQSSTDRAEPARGVQGVKDELSRMGIVVPGPNEVTLIQLLTDQAVQSHYLKRPLKNADPSALMDHIKNTKDAIAWFNQCHWALVEREKFFTDHTMRELGMMPPIDVGSKIMEAAQSGKMRSPAGSSIWRHVSKHPEYDFTLPVVYANHLPPDYEDSIVPRLNRDSMINGLYLDDPFMRVYEGNGTQYDELLALRTAEFYANEFSKIELGQVRLALLLWAIEPVLPTGWGKLNTVNPNYGEGFPLTIKTIKGCYTVEKFMERLRLVSGGRTTRVVNWLEENTEQDFEYVSSSGYHPSRAVTSKHVMSFTMRELVGGCADPDAQWNAHQGDNDWQILEDDESKRRLEEALTRPRD